MTEKNFQKQVFRDLKKLPKSFFYKSHDMSVGGIPDVVGVLNGNSVWLELKGDKGRPSPLQIHTVNKIRQAGGVAKIVYPHEWPVVYEELTRLAHSII